MPKSPNHKPIGNTDNRRILASLTANEEEKERVKKALDICRSEVPEFAEISMNSFVRAAVLKYVDQILAKHDK